MVHCADDGPAALVISDRTRSGGTLRRAGSPRYAVLGDQGHRRGFRIRLFEAGRADPIQTVRTRAAVLWKEACALAEQLLLTGVLHDDGRRTEAVDRVPLTGRGRPRSGRPDHAELGPQLSLMDAGWPALERFPHNSRLHHVRTVVEADLLAAQDPLVVTGFVSLGRLLDLLARGASSNWTDVHCGRVEGRQRVGGRRAWPSS
jgi:hypothetical protein